MIFENNLVINIFIGYIGNLYKFINIFYINILYTHRLTLVVLCGESLYVNVVNK